MDVLLRNKTALVTGASGDIGSAVAVTLAQNGARVIATYNKGEERARALQKQAEDGGLKLEVRHLNVGDEYEVNWFFERLASEGTLLDVMINVAGHSDKRIWYSKPQELTSNDWIEVLKVDLIGSFNCSVKAAQMMLKKGGGCIVNFSSAAGVTGHTEGLPYTAAKAALLAITKSLAYVYGPKVRVNAVAPGNIEGGSIKWADAEQVELMKNEASLKRLGKPSEVANAVLFLASDLSSFITGQTILVDGGI
jgi:3-oxoacyl-[acyl-carrier protein] reductase